MNYVQVTRQVTFVCGLELALVAFVRPVFCVSSHVALKILLLIGCIIADFALEWLFSPVDSKMRRQIMFFAEYVVTEGAYEVFFLLVDFLVYVPIARP